MRFAGDNDDASINGISAVVFQKYCPLWSVRVEIQIPRLVRSTRLDTNRKLEEIEKTTSMDNVRHG